MLYDSAMDTNDANVVNVDVHVNVRVVQASRRWRMYDGKRRVIMDEGGGGISSSGSGVELVCIDILCHEQPIGEQAEHT